jgi:hypothetical protein
MNEVIRICINGVCKEVNINELTKVVINNVVYVIKIEKEI